MAPLARGVRLLVGLLAARRASAVGGAEAGEGENFTLPELVHAARPWTAICQAAEGENFTLPELVQPPANATWPPAEDIIVFTDTDGDCSVVAGTGGQLWLLGPLAEVSPGWTAVREVQLDFAGPCRLQLTFVPTSPGPARRALVAKPPPGDWQWMMGGRLVRVAKAQEVQLSGTALDSLGAPAGAPGWHQPPLEIPASLSSDDRIRLRVPLAGWAGENTSSNCVAIVQRPEDCHSCTFSPADCPAAAPWSAGNGSTFLDVELPLLAFTPSAEQLVCVQGDATPTVGNASDAGPLLLGTLRYQWLPVVTFMVNVVPLSVRTFLNPGWNERIRLECRNCTADTRIAVRPIAADVSCKGPTQQALAALAAAVRDGQVPSNVDLVHHRHTTVEEIVRTRGSPASMAGVACEPLPRGPCGESEADDDSAAVAIVGYPTLDDDQTPVETVTFAVEGTRRLLASERKAFFHQRGALCFFPSADTANGWLVGFVAVHMDGPDMQAFIGFVCFFGVALPLICLVTALLHYNKYERCKQHVHAVRLDYQREQLEREMALRQASGEGASGSPVITTSLLPEILLTRQRPRATPRLVEAFSPAAGLGVFERMSGLHILGMPMLLPPGIRF